MIVIVEQSKNGIFLTPEEASAEWIIVAYQEGGYVIYKDGHAGNRVKTLDEAYKVINNSRIQLAEMHEVVPAEKSAQSNVEMVLDAYIGALLGGSMAMPSMRE